MYALLDAVKASTNSSLKLLSFEGLTVTLDLERTIEGMKEGHPNLKIVHGGTGGYQVPKPLPTPIEKLTQYCRENNVRLIDLFRTFDKEQLNVLPEMEFRNALRVSTISFNLKLQWCSWGRGGEGRAWGLKPPIAVDDY